MDWESRQEFRLPPGTIAAAVLSSLAFTAILGLGIFLYVKSRRRTELEAAEERYRQSLADLFPGSEADLESGMDYRAGFGAESLENKDSIGIGSAGKSGLPRKPEPAFLWTLAPSA